MIYNRERAKQLIDFDGMKWGRCRPTDLDFSLDIGGRYFVFVELKVEGVPLSQGQRIHLEHLVDSIVEGGREAVAIFAHHNVVNWEDDIIAAESKPVQYYYGGRWHSLEGRDYPDLNFLITSMVEEWKK